MPNLNCEHQDATSSEARTSYDHSDKHGGTYRETCRGEIDFRIQGLPLSAVQEHDHTGKQAVQKRIHQFEKSSEQRSIPRKPTTEARVQSVQREVEGYDLQHGMHGVLRFSRALPTYNAPTA